MTSLKKKICVTVFLDELFEVIEDPPPRQFHVAPNKYKSKQRESASKTSFTRKPSTIDYKPRSWSENQFLQRGKIEKRIKKPRGCKQNVTIVVKDELDRIELEEKNKIENATKNSPLQLAIKEKNVEESEDDFDWSKESIVSDTSDNYSELSQNEEKRKIDKCTQFENISPPNYQTKEIIEASKLSESKQVVQKIEYHKKAEVIKADNGLLDEDLSTLNMIRHCYRYDTKKKSFQELYRKKNYEIEDSSSQTDSEDLTLSESSVSHFDVKDFPDIKPEWCDTQTLSMLGSTYDVKLKAFLNGNGERLLCYQLSVQPRNPMEKIGYLQEIKAVPKEIVEKTEIGIADVAEYRFIARVSFVKLLTDFRISRGILVDEKVTQTEDDVSENVSFKDAESEMMINRESDDILYTVTFEDDFRSSVEDFGGNVRTICSVDSID